MNHKEKFHRTENSEIDFTPYMNMMVVLIPILLISAEFARISIIDINLLSYINILQQVPKPPKVVTFRLSMIEAPEPAAQNTA